MEKRNYTIQITAQKNEKILGRAFVPSQNYAEVYDAKTALISGTAFKELDMPYRIKSIGGFR